MPARFVVDWPALIVCVTGGKMSDEKRQMEPDSTVYKTLLESTRAIPWKIDWASKRFAYIGPQIEQLLGWSRESWATVNDWADRMHPDDRERVVNYCVSQSQNGVDHEADYRARRSDGNYVWIRDVVHVVRKHGEAEALIGFMFDISERKRNEQELSRLRDKLEALSLCDGLTGIANRRMLDRALAREWTNAIRTGQPISVILADIDFFKQYNDRYGHLAGDECLKKVADLLGQCAARPHDVVARYGGEEFVLVLPDTDVNAAREVAERCKQSMLEARIPHENSATGPWVSLSIGTATMTPEEGQPIAPFLEAVDKSMYRAKQTGRNRVA